MQNTIELNKMDVQELDAQEMSQTDGGVLALIAMPIVVAFVAGYIAGYHSC
jgi:lactobin A/cerein 7B family class IIb bacteriocin